MRPTAARRRVRTVLGVVALLAIVFGTLWVAAQTSPPTSDRSEALALNPTVPVSRTGRAPAVAAVLLVIAALAVLATWSLVRQPSRRLVPVPLRTPRGRGPPRSTSI